MYVGSRLKPVGEWEGAALYASLPAVSGKTRRGRVEDNVGITYLKVFSANGYYDAVTPFFQTVLNFENMPLSDPHARNNLTIHNYPSGHMVYLDNESRSSMRADLAAFYEGTRAYSPAVAAKRAPQETGRISRSPYRRRFSRTPY